MLGLTKKLALFAAIAVALVCAAVSAQHIDGPFPLPPAPVKGIVEGPLPLGAVVLDRPYDYDWWYGCSPTAAGMYFGWWEEHGYPSVFPGDHRDWVLGLGCPNFNPANFEDAHGVVATWEHHQSGQDYGWKYGFWRGHPPACLADFMLTRNGGTSRSTMEWGFENFAAWDDPETQENESHVFLAETHYDDYGWTYEDYCAEIDAGRPVHLGLSYYSGGGHSVVGLGYNNTGGKQNFYLHTTWNSGLVEWPWEDPYGWTVYGGTTLQPSSDPTPEFSGYFAVSHEVIGALRVWIGAGDPASPDWELQVWNLQGYDFVNLVQTDIDLTDGLDLFGGQWYLKVTDDGSGKGGHIEDFQLRSEGERWFTDDIHVTIPSGGTAYAYINLPPGVVHVDRNAPGPEHDGLSWDTAFLTIQEGVDAATPDGDVWVADGTYVENVVMGEGVAIYGGFLGAEPGGYETELDQRESAANITTIDGGEAGSCVTMADSGTVDGFTITNGSGTLYAGYRFGGGFYCKDLRATGIIANNTIAGNSAARSGGGIYLDNSSPAVTGNTITGNSAGDDGGGIYFHNSSPTVTGNTITANNANIGGGILCAAYSSALVANNAITANSTGAGGGGIFCWSSSPTVTGNTITGNCAGLNGGGICCYKSSPTVTNNAITANFSARNGGGISCYNSSPTVTNNAITANSSARNGGGICCYKSSPTVICNTVCGNSAVKGRALACDTPHEPSDVTITNCILWNGGDEIWNNDNSTITVTYSDVQGGWPGEGNIDADPMFADPGEGDFHLTADSPCIDAGTNEAPELPETDWDGEDRIVNGIVDMGADEYVTIYTEAPVPQPECDGPLFGGSQAGFPAWVWFSIPLTPDCPVGSGCADPNALLGFTCNGRLWYWDEYGKWAQVYQPPFVRWDLSVGDSYLMYLETDVTNPSYEGITPFIPWAFEFKLGRMGWTWIGMPGLAEVTGDDFMSSVTVKYPSDDTAEYRTAQADYDATPDNWVSWGWPYWNTWLQAPETFTPYAPFGHNTCYPWLGYRVWINVGTATDEEDPDQVTLIWPKR